jgi:hypothetical protein
LVRCDTPRPGGGNVAARTLAYLVSEAMNSIVTNDLHDFDTSVDMVALGAGVLNTPLTIDK